MVQRALTPFNFSSQQTEIQASLGGSDDWHCTLRDESIPYWMADTGSFFVGHGFKAWDQSLNDEYDDGGDIMDFDRQKQLAIEMGATENMFSSVTNIFGLGDCCSTADSSFIWRSGSGMRSSARRSAALPGRFASSPLST